MLSKLLKYDFKSIKRFGFPTVIALAALTLLSGIGTYGYVKLISELSKNENETAVALLGIGGVLLIIAVITVIYAACIGIYAVIMVDFYKFTATDEAYLTFTLPVKPQQIIISKLINAYGWSFVIMLLAVAVVFSMMLGGIIGAFSIPEVEIDSTDVEKAVDGVMKVLDASQVFGNILTAVLTVIQALIGLAHGLLMYFMAIFLGSVIAKKHKVLASIGCVIGVLTLDGIVASIGQMVLYIASAGVLAVTEDYVLFQNIVIAAQLLYYAGISILYFFLLKNMMEKKLNLP